jgi:hypothetical protein
MLIFVAKSNLSQMGRKIKYTTEDDKVDVNEITKLTEEVIIPMGVTLTVTRNYKRNVKKRFSNCKLNFPNTKTQEKNSTRK